MLKVVALFEKKLIRERGIRLESFVLDDGWDNLQAGFWTVDTGKFPSGFDGLCRELERVGSHLGIWISPLGGYGDQRIQLARKAGIVPAGAGLVLDQPVYYDWWLRYCSDLMRKQGVNYFKWDNAANFTSLARIAGELRKIDPNVFINTTVNTFPSPFFLNSMDATWRGGGGGLWLVWARQQPRAVHHLSRSGVLADAHWVGGDPGKLEVYGCAAWSPRKGTMMLRNPSDQKTSVTWYDAVKWCNARMNIWGHIYSFCICEVIRTESKTARQTLICIMNRCDPYCA